MLVDVLENLQEDLDKIDYEIERIDKDLLVLDSNDGWDKLEIKSLRDMRSRYRRDKINLLKHYHLVNQDVSLRNQEIEMRISKMQAEIKFLGSTEQAIGDGKKILNYIDRMARLKVLGSEEAERPDDYYE